MQQPFRTWRGKVDDGSQRYFEKNAGGASRNTAKSVRFAEKEEVRTFEAEKYTQEEEEAVCISVVNTNEDLPNAHQAQHRSKPRVR